MRKVSIIIPAYNSAGTIERCINSILNTNTSQIEIIVVNDGSKDNLLEVLLPYSDKIKIITIKNGGVSNARNVGLKNATGDFIMFVDSDDYLADGAVDEMMKRQEETGADIVRSGYALVYENGTSKPPVNRFKNERLVEKPDFKNEIYTCFIDGILLNSVWSTLFKKEIVDGIGFRLDMKTAEDAVFSMHAYTNAKSVLIIPDMSYMYYQSDSSLTAKGLKLRMKYKCNFILASEMAGLLGKWDMNTLYWQARVWSRPLRLTFNKLKRIIYSSQA